MGQDTPSQALSELRIATSHQAQCCDNHVKDLDHRDEALEDAGTIAEILWLYKRD